MAQDFECLQWDFHGIAQSLVVVLYGRIDTGFSIGHQILLGNCIASTEILRDCIHVGIVGNVKSRSECRNTIITKKHKWAITLQIICCGDKLKPKINYGC